MPIIAKEKKSVRYLPPAENLQAVCFDVWDIGYQKSSYKGKEMVKPKVIIAWELAETIKSEDEQNGKRFRIYRPYNLSLGKKATLRKDLTSWRGRAFTEDELKSFDLESLIGANCMLSIIHNTEDGETYANIAAITAMPKGLPRIAPITTREIPDWIAEKQANAVDGEPVATVETEDLVPDEIPF